MNILLVYPEMPDTFWAMKHLLKVVGKKASYPPLGLMTVAAMLPDEWQQQLVDLNVHDLRDDHLQWADFVFLSAMNVQESSAQEVIERCNRAGVKIVAGGSLFTHEYDRFPGVDHFVLNEAEITLPEFLQDLEAGAPKPIYKVGSYADVHTTPLPRFDLIDMEDYLYAIVQYSRGCPYMCDFCDVTALFGRKPRTKTNEQIISELEDIRHSGNTDLILFADDNLIGNKRILKDELLPALIEWRKKVKPEFFFATQLTINLADDDELMQLMLDAGFRHIFVGIETPEEESLVHSRKKQNTRRDLLDNIYKLQGAGFIISGGFIVGFDTDTPTIFQRQIDLIQNSGIVLPIVNVLKAPPGTELFDRMKNEGRLLEKFGFSEADTNIVPEIGDETLFTGFKHLIDHIYTPESSYRRIRQFFNTYQFPKTNVRIKSSFRWKNLLIFLRIILLLGIRSNSRLYFWKLLGWSVLKAPKHIDKAVLFAIMIHQMFGTYHQLIPRVNARIRKKAA